MAFSLVPADRVTLTELIALYRETDLAVKNLSQWNMLEATTRKQFETKANFQIFLDSHRLVNQVNLSINQSINQTINQSINQSINLFFKRHGDKGVAAAEIQNG